MSHNKSKKSKINKYTIDDKHRVEDYVALETPLEIRLGHTLDTYQTLAITMCTPLDVKDLVYGHLFTESIISNSQDVKEINLFDTEFGLVVEILLQAKIAYKKYLNKRHGMIHASCGVCGKTQIDDILMYNYPKSSDEYNKIDAKIITSLPKKLCQNQSAFKQTGGLHASALFDNNGELIMVMEDIGRHNALDKLIGWSLQQDILPLNDKIILLSGRVSFELVHKSLFAGLTTLCAIGAPSSLSVEVAKENRIDLCGFVKAASYNCYT